MVRKDPALLECKLLEDEFDAKSFLVDIKTSLPDLSESDRWIRSGIHIPEKFKKDISSYRLIASSDSANKANRKEVLLVKPQPGVSLDEAMTSCVGLIKEHLEESGTGVAFVALVSAAETSWYSLLISGGAPKSAIQIPADILDHICTETLKEYLTDSCEVSRAALDGYFSKSYVLYDDSVIKAKAHDIDKALAKVKVCDISAGAGQIIFSMADKIASVREDMNKYISGADRTKKRFLSHALINSIYATDLDAGALDLLKIEVAARAESGKKFPDKHFPAGNILFDDLFAEVEFDIIVTNPPHMRQEKFSSINDDFKEYRSFHENADLYCYFAEKAFACAADGGTVALLMSNKWMSSGYGAPLRLLLSEFRISELVDYGNRPTLEGTVTPMSLLIARKKSPDDNIKVVTVSERDVENISEYAEENSEFFTLETLGEDPWIFESADISALTEKIKLNGVPLEEYVDNQIYRGILTGLNDAFVLDAGKAKRIIEACPSCEKILRPFLSGRNVKRYAEPKVKKYLIFMPKGFTDENREDKEPWQWLAQTYPAIAEHLAPFENRASARKDKGKYWWELRSCKYYDAFDAPKIISPSIVKKISATIDENSLLSNDKTSIIASDDYYLLGLLNSRLMDFYARRITSALLNDHFELRPSNLSALPVKAVRETNKFQKALRGEIAAGAKKLSELYSIPEINWEDKTFDDISECEKKINRAVYRLYRLTPKEIKIIENN